MRLIKATYFALPAVLLATSCTKPVEEIAGCQFPSKENMSLTWADEFEADVINTQYWGYDTADGCQLDTVGGTLCGWGNNELQYYTMREENARIEDGNLIITAKREIPFYQGKQYTSARLVTKNKVDFTYGRVDVRAKIPRGQGIWPAIWMLPTDTVYGIWPASGEIDIMESIGSNTEEILGTIHYGHDFWRYYSQYYTDSVLVEGSDPPQYDPVDFADGFHVYSTIWTEDCILFQVDGNDIGEPVTRSTVLPTTWPFDQDFHIILNIAVGGNLPGAPDASTQFPQTMEVDYVRVYQ
ncbi:MAG TPA: glycoside hydrolase family 16 protein [Cryomorphaceae bacterium]|nr:glycoside hydrolase family 16 protein [Cryomorphaceae bacterium]